MVCVGWVGQGEDECELREGRMCALGDRRKWDGLIDGRVQIRLGG